MRHYIDLIENSLGEPKRHVMTTAEAKIIRDAARKVSRSRVTKLEVGIKAKGEQESMNLLVLAPDGDIHSGIETIDIRPWAFLRKGFPLVDGNAVLDIFIQGEGEIEGNIYPVWRDGELIAVLADGERILWQKAGLTEHVCQTPGADFQIQFTDHSVGVTVELPPEVEVPDMSDDLARKYEDEMHDAMEEIVAGMIHDLDPQAEDHWDRARENDPVEEGMRGLIRIVENALMEAGSAPLYHATNFRNAKSILADGVIRAFGGDERGYICTTRDRNFVYKDQHIQFVIDADRVRTRYAIEPVDFHAGFANARRESEERILARALPLSMVNAVVLMPIQKYPPGITAAMHREGDEIAALATQHGLRVIDQREPLAEHALTEEEIIGVSEEKEPQRPNRKLYRNNPAAQFIDELEQEHTWEVEVAPYTTWSYVETPKGKATVKVDWVDDITVNLFWLLAVDRGAGRAAMEIMCRLADKYGVTMVGDATPLPGKQGDGGFKLTIEQLLKFYKSFGFRKKGWRTENNGVRYPFIIRAARPQNPTETIVPA